VSKFTLSFAALVAAAVTVGPVSMQGLVFHFGLAPLPVTGYRRKGVSDELSVFHKTNAE